MFIKLTNAYNDTVLYVKPFKIHAIGCNLDGTYVYINGNTVTVKETPDEILKLIKEME